jgi:hypothetical protein
VSTSAVARDVRVGRSRIEWLARKQAHTRFTEDISCYVVGIGAGDMTPQQESLVRSHHLSQLKRGQRLKAGLLGLCPDNT